MKVFVITARDYGVVGIYKTKKAAMEAKEYQDWNLAMGGSHYKSTLEEIEVQTKLKDTPGTKEWRKMTMQESVEPNDSDRILSLNESLNPTTGDKHD